MDVYHSLRGGKEVGEANGVILGIQMNVNDVGQCSVWDERHICSTSLNEGLRSMLNVP